MNDDRELDQISEHFARESAALRNRTLLLSAIPVVVGAIVIVTAYSGVTNARAKLAEIQKLRESLAAEVEALQAQTLELEAQSLELEEKIEQQKAISTHLQSKLPQEEKRTASLIQSGLDAYNRGDWQQAVQTLESAVRRDAGVAEVHYRLGISLWRTGKKEAALTQIQSAFELDPGYEKLARSNPALQQLWAYRELVAEPVGAARDEAKTRHIEEALESAESGSYDRAAESYGKALEADPDNARLHGLRGSALYEKGAVDPAIASYRECLKLDPRSAECHYNLGKALWQKEDREAALAAFKQAFELDPELEARARQDPVVRRIQTEAKRRLPRRNPG